MIAAIMQPYFFPYIGYFQLMAACDVFVIHDDVQFTKKGWIHRNRVLVNQQPEWLTMPVASGSHDLPINRRLYTRGDSDRAILRRVAGAYAAAPHIGAAMTILDEAMQFAQPNMAQFNANALGLVARTLKVAPRIELASRLPKDNSLRGQDRVIDICKVVGATEYVNPPGGTLLYEPSAFAERGIKLRFLDPRLNPYPQGTPEFVPALSVIDLLMFNDAAAVAAMAQRPA